MKNNKRKIIPILAVVISLIASFSLGYNIKTKDNYAKSIDKKESIEITTSEYWIQWKETKVYILIHRWWNELFSAATSRLLPKGNGK